MHLLIDWKIGKRRHTDLKILIFKSQDILNAEFELKLRAIDDFNFYTNKTRRSLRRSWLETRDFQLQLQLSLRWWQHRTGFTITGGSGRNGHTERRGGAGNGPDHEFNKASPTFLRRAATSNWSVWKRARSSPIVSLKTCAHTPIYMKTRTRLYCHSEIIFDKPTLELTRFKPTIPTPSSIAGCTSPQLNDASNRVLCVFAFASANRVNIGAFFGGEE